MYNLINNQIKIAMKSHDKNKLSVLRILKSDITIKAKELKITENQLDKNILIGVVEKVLKKYKEELSFIKDENKTVELQKAIKLLESYLPEKLSIEEVIKLVDKVISDVKNVGEVMKTLSKELKGKADMKEVKKLVDQRMKS